MAGRLASGRLCGGLLGRAARLSGSPLGSGWVGSARGIGNKPGSEEQNQHFAAYNRAVVGAVPFSKTRAAVKAHQMDPLVGDHEHSDQVFPYASIMVGLVLIGALLYSFATAKPMSAWENEEKTVEAVDEMQKMATNMITERVGGKG